jgi:hypothetical protein
MGYIRRNARQIAGGEKHVLYIASDRYKRHYYACA